MYLELLGIMKVRGHPAMFPVKVPEFFIKLATRRGERVLDPFWALVLPLMVAAKTKRVCLGIDLQPKYIDIVLTRWEALTGQKAVKVNG